MSKSVTAQIVEGYALRKCRDEHLHYLHRAQGSAEETMEHLKYLHEGGSLKDSAEFKILVAGYEKLIPKIASFIIGVEHKRSKPYYLRAASETTTHAIGRRSSSPRPAPPPSAGFPVTAERSAKPGLRESRIKNRESFLLPRVRVIRSDE